MIIHLHQWVPQIWHLSSDLAMVHPTLTLGSVPHSQFEVPRVWHYHINTWTNTNRLYVAWMTAHRISFLISGFASKRSKVFVFRSEYNHFPFSSTRTHYILNSSPKIGFPIMAPVFMFRFRTADPDPDTIIAALSRIAAKATAAKWSTSGPFTFPLYASHRLNVLPYDPQRLFNLHC